MTGQLPQGAQAAARWVDDFLLPAVVRERGAGSDALRFLQVEPDDELEADRLRRLGHHCDVLLHEGAQRSESHWRVEPLHAGDALLPPRAQGYDVIWSGAFARLHTSAAQRRQAAVALRALCAPHGAVLLTLGNAACPLQPSAGAATLPSLVEAFVDGAGFEPPRRLSLAGHHGWSRLPRPLRVLAPLLAGYLAWSSRPEAPRRYASALNPWLALWFAQGPRR